MIDFKNKLIKITTHWRMTARKTRIVADEIPNLLARGHMHGVSDGLDIAADDLDVLLKEEGTTPNG